MLQAFREIFFFFLIWCVFFCLIKNLLRPDAFSLMKLKKVFFENYLTTNPMRNFNANKFPEINSVDITERKKALKLKFIFTSSSDALEKKKKSLK